MAKTLQLALTMSERIRGIRLASRINQTKLAELLECSQGTVSKLEAGILEPTSHQLTRIRSVFQISIDSLIDDQLDFVTIATRCSNHSFSVEYLYEKLNLIPTDYQI